MPVARPGGAIEAQPPPPARVREVATALPSRGARTTAPRPAHGRRHPCHPRRRLLPPLSPLPVRGARPGRLVRGRPPLLRLLGQERPPWARRVRARRAARHHVPPQAGAGRRRRACLGLLQAVGGADARATGAARSSVTAARAHWGDAVAGSGRRGDGRCASRGSGSAALVYNSVALGSSSAPARESTGPTAAGTGVQPVSGQGGGDVRPCREERGSVTPRVSAHAAAAFPAIPAINPPCAGTQASRTPSSPSCCLALELLGRATHPRCFQSHLDGRHRDAAVERPLQSPLLSSSEHPRTTRVPELDFVRPFALSSLPRSRTPPPPRWNAGELTPAAEPSHRRSSARSDPLASAASS
ncbi:hypothetical protein PVAP13_4NG013060 [Panicum virgatum]|uniref:Uncharacterized protein n=1 Tax=Panicum virgatum TaxID=38727 RepID=A0A8T0T3H4_PANVG|nr:hypothetical protein PVAP13_4NG013060 [Panicum virgatum]